MGYALAKEAKNLGAEVILISGPVSIPSPEGIHVIHVKSADEMYDAVFKHQASYDIAILSAAVADYKPAQVAEQKIKKADNEHHLDLIKNKDILRSLGLVKKEGQFLVGFALETQNELENALVKLTEKNLDLIVLNSLNDSGAGFGGDTNLVKLITPDNIIDELPLQSKTEVAKQIIAKINQLIH